MTANNAYKIEEDLGYFLFQDDCLSKLRDIEDNCIDALITDPPAGISFMGKAWDDDKGGKNQWKLWMQEIAKECLRVLKPGAHGLIWAIPRTSHWTADAFEDAGFEVRDIVTHIFGSGFPKSSDISKQIDKQCYNYWSDISKSIDNISTNDIIHSWKEDLNNAKYVKIGLEKNLIEIGTSTQKKDFALVSVMHSSKIKNSNFFASIVESELFAQHPMFKTLYIAQEIVEENITLLQKNAIIADELSQNQEANLNSVDFIVPLNVKELLNENQGLITKAEEVLMICLGKRKSLKWVDINVLCVTLSDALKHIILNQLKSSLNSDMISQMDFASVTTVTITESTAESLILSMVDILKNKAIDKMHGAEREVIGSHKKSGAIKSGRMHAGSNEIGIVTEIIHTLPATEDAKKWQGWGTALKPASEHWILVRKPLSEKTVAKNVLKHGTGGLNIDASRIDGQPRTTHADGNRKGTTNGYEGGWGKDFKNEAPIGRFPANLVLDDFAAELLDEQSGILKSGARQKNQRTDPGILYRPGSYSPSCESSIGGASRFFYVAKASKSDKNEGLEGFIPKKVNDGRKTEIDNPFQRCETERLNTHPTVKNTKLMEYLIKLITPENGIVLDPFLGSGSTGVAAIKNGFRFIGIEKEQEYFEIAKNRILKVI